jgi:hypothetical protein
MSGVELVAVATGGYGVLFAVLYTAARLRNATTLRRAAPLPASVDVDPFHALTVSSGRPDAMDRAAVASLLSDELITIDAAGVVRVADATREPAHPVPAAWLECLQRAERPATMAEFRDDPELRRRHARFLEEQERRLSNWTGPGGDGEDGLGCSLAVLGLLVGLFDGITLALAVPTSSLGPTRFEQVTGVVAMMVVLAPLLGIVLSGSALSAMPKRPSRLRTHCAGLRPHPALAALTTDQHHRFSASAARTAAT